MQQNRNQSGAEINLLVDDELSGLLDQIPSETTPQERRLLWRFFGSIWDGNGDVVEVGPFLGGTTRAIALGMLTNPRYQQGRLLTYDRFERYYKADQLQEFVAPLIEQGILSKQSVEQIKATASFRDIFNEIHASNDYGRIIQALDRPLPDSAAHAAKGGNFFALDDSLECSAYFVDGCKSWFGTKYFMMQCCRHAKPGSFFIYQDYLQYTCFWLPAFIAAFRDYFSLVADVSQTYVFQLTAALPPEMIDRSYPDAAETWDAGRFRELMDWVRRDSEQREHKAALLKQEMQYGAALAYIGQKDAARACYAQLKELTDTDPFLQRYAKFLAEASRRPTFRAGKGWLEL